MGASPSKTPSAATPPLTSFALERRCSSGYIVEPAGGCGLRVCRSGGTTRRPPDAARSSSTSDAAFEPGVFDPSRSHPTVAHLISDLKSAPSRSRGARVSGSPPSHSCVFPSESYAHHRPLDPPQPTAFSTSSTTPPWVSPRGRCLYWTPLRRRGSFPKPPRSSATRASSGETSRRPIPRTPTSSAAEPPLPGIPRVA